MAGKKNAKRNQEATKTSLTAASRGVSTGQDFANLMSALMADVISGAVPPSVANAACNAGGKLLKVVELQMKYGKPTETGSKVLELAMKQPLLQNEQIQ